MIDISEKPVVHRSATAEGTILLKKETINAIKEKRVKKGDVLETAKIAGIQASKTAYLDIPYCHIVPIESTEVIFDVGQEYIKVSCTVKASYKTGVEMDALNCVSRALLTLWDMVKYLEKDRNGQYPSTIIKEIKVLKKKKDAKKNSEGKTNLKK